MLQALLSPRMDGPGAESVAYPKPGAVDPLRLPKAGVWSANFSWRRGVPEYEGNANDGGGSVGGPVLVGDTQTISMEPSSRGAIRFVLPIGAVAPTTAAKPRGIDGASQIPIPPKGARKSTAETMRLQALQNRGLPFGARFKTHLDTTTSLFVPPPTRYNPVRPSEGTPRVADFGAGGVLEREVASSGGATGAEVGPGSYVPRIDIGGLPQRAPHVRIIGKPPNFGIAAPTVAPGDYEPGPPTPGPSYGFSRGKRDVGLEVARAKVSTGTAEGLLAWAALEPELAKHGIATPKDPEKTLKTEMRRRQSMSAQNARATSPTVGRIGQGGKEEYLVNLAFSLGREPLKW